MATYNEISGKLINVTGDKTDPSFDHIVAGTDVIYDSEYPLIVNGYVECDTTPISDPTGNPHEQGWCEEEMVGGVGNGNYILTEDTTVELDKDYYRPIGARQDAINNQLRTTISDLSGVVLYANEYNEATIHEGDNPQANGWYELSGTTYVLTTDTTVVSGKTYYIRVTKITSNEDKIIGKEDGYIPTAGAVGRAMGANFEDNLTSTSTVKGLTANMGRVLNEKKADKNGWYEQFVAGASLSVIGDDTDDKAKFFYRGTGDSEDTGGTKHTIEKGTATFDAIYGNTIKWNQLAPKLTAGDRVRNGVTFSIDNNGIITVNGTATSDTELQISSGISVIKGHKFLLSGCPNGGSVNTYYLHDGIWQSIGDIGNGIIFVSNLAKVGLQVGIKSGYTANNLIFRPRLIDLTNIFGEGNEPSTVAEFEAWVSQNVSYQDYYPYNTGSLISLKPKKLISTGFNLWDEQFENGKYIDPTTGDINTQYSNRRASETYYRCIPNAYYYVGRFVGGILNNTNYQQNIYFYKSDKTFISSNVLGGLVQAPSSAYYFRVASSVSTGNICINLSDPAKNGTYMPYMQPSTVDLSWIMDIPDPNDSSKKLFPYGLLSADSVKDEVYPDKVIKRVGCVDLGTLTWSKTGSNPDYPERNAYEGAVQGIFIPSSQSQRRDGIVSIKFRVPAGTSPIDLSYGGNSLGVDNTMATAIGKIFIRCDQYNYPDSFKIAMNGVMLYYKLATPIEVTFEEPDTHPMNYEVEPGGIEEFVKADAAPGENEPTSTSLTATITYPLDLLGTIRNLQNNFTTLGALGSAFTSLVNVLNSLLADLEITKRFSVTGSEDYPSTYTFGYAEPESSNSVENESI